MAHHFHSAGDSGIDAIKPNDGHGAEHHRKSIGHLWVEPESSSDESDNQNRNRCQEDALCHSEKNGEPKQGSGPGPIAPHLSPGDKRYNGVVESKDANLADKIRGGPGHRKDTECARPKYSRDEKCEHAPKIRGKHGNKVRPCAAF